MQYCRKRDRLAACSRQGAEIQSSLLIFEGITTVLFQALFLATCFYTVQVQLHASGNSNLCALHMHACMLQACAFVVPSQLNWVTLVGVDSLLCTWLQ